MKTRHQASALPALAILFAAATFLSGQNVLYKPYIQSGDNSTFKAKDQMVAAWQTDEAKPNNSAYLVEYGTSINYGSKVVPTG